MQRTEVICDICGARKGETNHWWKVVESDECFQLMIPPWEVDKSIMNRDYCSESCVSKALSQFMNSIRLNLEEQRKQIASEELERDPTLRLERDN